jgi:hypothetical protein
MQIKVSEFKENEDGSANVMVDFDNEAREYLLNYGFIHMLKEAVEQGKQYKAED